MRYVKTYQEFLNELMIHGQSSDKILVFDIDDTLIKSNARVFVMNGNKVVRTLDSQEYNDYKLKTGETFSYDEFRSLNIMLDADIKPYFKTMEREYKKGVHISILTARAGKKMIHDFFIRKANIDIHPKLIFTIGDDMSDLTVAEKKAKCIRSLVSYGYKTLIFFDDNIDNLKEVKSMGERLGVKIHTIQA